MFLINFLDRNITDPHWPAFECIYAAETIILVVYLLLSVAVVRASWKSSFHLNIRLRIILIIIQGDIPNLARFSILLNQVFGPANRETTNHVIVSSLFREAFLAYFTTLPSIIALDRWIASFAWSWYEKGSQETLAFFVFHELLLYFISWIISCLLVYDFITDMQLVLYCGIALLIGSTACHFNFFLFILVYRHNLGELNKFKKGAIVGEYAVARSFQIRENIALMKMFSRIVGPLVVFCAPEFLFYPVYTVVPAGIGWDNWRHLSIALYDLWIGVISLVIAICIPLYESRIARNVPMPAFARKWIQRKASPTNTVAMKSSTTETSTYFEMLDRDLR